MPNFLFVRDPLAWYESYYSYTKQRSPRVWGSGTGKFGAGLRRYYWHPWKELEDCNMDSFDNFISDVIDKCPGYVSRIYFSYVFDEHTIVGRQENLTADLVRILKLFGYDCDGLKTGNLGRSNESVKEAMWDSALRERILQLEAPFYAHDWESRLRILELKTGQ